MTSDNVKGVASLATLLRQYDKGVHGGYEHQAQWLTEQGVTMVHWGAGVPPVDELARFAEGDTRPVPQTYTTAGASRLGEPSPEGPWEAAYIEHRGAWSIRRRADVDRAHEVFAMTADQAKAEAVRDALNTVAVRDALDRVSGVRAGLRGDAMSTKLDTEAITARLKNATPGPWKRDRNWYVTGPEHQWDNTCANQRIAHIIGPRVTMGDLNRPEADQEFIAHAPGDIAALLAEVSRLRAEMERTNLRALRPGESRCACCAGSGITREPEPGEMLDI